MNRYAIEIEHLEHFYDTPSRRFLVSVDRLKIPMGSLTTFLGSSGCGKSTVMSRLGLLMPAMKAKSTVSKFLLAERHLNGMTTAHNLAALQNQGPSGQSQIDSIRRRIMGYFLQSGELIPTLTIRENVAMPLQLNGYSRSEAYDRADELLAYLFDVSTKNLPNKLALDFSGGEYQRIALARAIAHRPQILFVDEPTSSLDTHNKHRVLDCMMKLVRDSDTTVVMINHDESIAREYSDFIVNFEARKEGWERRLPHGFRECDGFGCTASFESRIDDQWIQSDPDFNVQGSISSGVEHV